MSDGSLSQDEIDALLQGSGGFDVDPGGGGAAAFGADTATAAGTVTDGPSGTLAATEAADSAALAGTVTQPVKPPAGGGGGVSYGPIYYQPQLPRRVGQMRCSERPDGAQMAGLVRMAGSLAASEAPDTARFTITGDMTPVLIRRAATWMLLES